MVHSLISQAGVAGVVAADGETSVVASAAVAEEVVVAVASGADVKARLPLLAWMTSLHSRPCRQA